MVNIIRKKKKDEEVAVKVADTTERRKDRKNPEKKRVSKSELVEQIRKYKQDMREMRFGSTKEMQKDGSRRQVRKKLARAATHLTAMRKSGLI